MPGRIGSVGSSVVSWPGDPTRRRSLSDAWGQRVNCHEWPWDSLGSDRELALSIAKVLHLDLPIHPLRPPHQLRLRFHPPLCLRHVVNRTGERHAQRPGHAASLPATLRSGNTNDNSRVDPKRSPKHPDDNLADRTATKDKTARLAEPATACGHHHPIPASSRRLNVE